MLKRTYGSSPGKTFIREKVDRRLLERLHQQRGEPLNYFGLPGAELLDIQCWKPYLGEVAAVERDRANLLAMDDVAKLNMTSLRFTPHHGDMDKVILNGHGWKWRRGGEPHRPLVGVSHPSHARPGWYFDVVNLDYFGPFLPDGGQGARERADAIRKLFATERVDGWNRWVLLITVEADLITPAVSTQMRQYLQGIQDDASAQTVSLLEFLMQPVMGNQELVATRLIHAVAASLIARSASYVTSLPRGTILYSGSNDQPMVHLAYEFTPADGPLPPPTPLDALLRSPLLRVTSGTTPQLEFLSEQAPDLTGTNVREALVHLDGSTVDSLISCMPGVTT
jgi:hypothetical protein